MVTPRHLQRPGIAHPQVLQPAGVVAGRLHDAARPGPDRARACAGRRQQLARPLLAPPGIGWRRRDRPRSRRPPGRCPPADPWSPPAAPPRPAPGGSPPVSASTAARSSRCQVGRCGAGDSGRPITTWTAERKIALDSYASPTGTIVRAARTCARSRPPTGRCGRRRSSAAAAGDRSGRSPRGTAPATARRPAPGGWPRSWPRCGRSGPPRRRPADPASGRRGMASKQLIASRPSGCLKKVLLARKRTGRPTTSASTSGSSSPFGWLAVNSTGDPLGPRRWQVLEAQHLPARVIQAHQRQEQTAEKAAQQRGQARRSSLLPVARRAAPGTASVPPAAARVRSSEMIRPSLKRMVRSQ